MTLRRPAPRLLAAIPVGPGIAALPNADLHLHSEALARLDRVVARRHGYPPHDWHAEAHRLLASTPPDAGRLTIYDPVRALSVQRDLDADPELFVARVVDVLGEGAADGAVLLEVRFGAADVLHRPDFMALFREAERRVRQRYTPLVAEALGNLHLAAEPERLAPAQRQFEACLLAARDGFAGVDLTVLPYATEAPAALWQVAYRWAERAHDTGLGITVHVGEYSVANINAALRVPHLQRLGHAAYAATDARLLERLVSSNATVGCSLTSNVIFGAVSSYEAHPVRCLVDAGVPVTLNTDDPVHVCTTIAREYAIAAVLGFSVDELLQFTHNAIQASFTRAERREALFALIRQALVGGSYGPSERVREEHRRLSPGDRL